MTAAQIRSAAALVHYELPTREVWFEDIGTEGAVLRIGNPRRDRDVKRYIIAPNGRWRKESA